MMKIIRKHLPKISLFMSITLLFFSCNQYDDSLNSENMEQSLKYSGEEIFTGLFFFQNDIPSNISSLHGMKAELENKEKSNSEISTSLKEISEVSVSYINQKYPDFFKELQQTMYSGNLYEIEKSLNTSVKMIEQATLASNKYSKAFVIGEKIQNNEDLKKQITKLDLNNETDVKEFRSLVSKIADEEFINREEAIAFAAVAAVAYIVAAAVSFVAAAYSVITKVAYWDPTQEASEALISEESTVTKEIIVAEIGDFFSSK